jgi:hypothetical protein
MSKRIRRSRRKHVRHSISQLLRIIARTEPRVLSPNDRSDDAVILKFAKKLLETRRSELCKLGSAA